MNKDTEGEKKNAEQGQTGSQMSLGDKLCLLPCFWAPTTLSSWWLQDRWDFLLPHPGGGCRLRYQ